MHAPSSPIEPIASLPHSVGELDPRKVDPRDVDPRDVVAATRDEMDEVDEVDEVELDGVVAVEALARWLEARSRHPAFASRR